MEDGNNYGPNPLVLENLLRHEGAMDNAPSVIKRV
jgi:hypothetical protein